MRPLDNSARLWVDLQLAFMHRAVSQAIEASNRWAQINDELMVKFHTEGRSDLEISRIKAVNLALNDALNAYQFHAGKAQLHAAVIQAELAARTMLGDAPAGEQPAEPRRRPRPSTLPTPTPPTGGAR